MDAEQHRAKPLQQCSALNSTNGFEVKHSSLCTAQWTALKYNVVAQFRLLALLSKGKSQRETKKTGIWTLSKCKFLGVIFVMYLDIFQGRRGKGVTSLKIFRVLRGGWGVQAVLTMTKLELFFSSHMGFRKFKASLYESHVVWVPSLYVTAMISKLWLKKHFKTDLELHTKL